MQNLLTWGRKCNWEMLRGLSPIFDGWGNFQWNSRSVFATYKQITFFRAGSAAQLTSYHADISLINKQYRKRGHKLHTAAKNSTNNHRPNGQTCLKIFASKRKSWSNLLKHIKKKDMVFDSKTCVFKRSGHTRALLHFTNVASILTFGIFLPFSWVFFTCLYKS